MKSRLFLLATLILGTSCFCGAQIDKKYALVIGVKDYLHVSPLKNSLNDAIDMSSVLKSKGFKVVEVYNPKTKRELQEAIKGYYNLINGQGTAAGLVFYSGHGMQVDGINYLMPTTANPQIKADLDDQAVRMEYLLSAIEQAGNPLNILIMDACRNNPFRGFSRSSDPGLTQVNAPKGSYVVYATAPGSVASDGLQRNGLFTSKLLKYINTPSVNIEQVFKFVARDVQQESGGAQVPWINYSYFGDFYFSGAGAQATVPSVTKSPSVDQAKGKGILTSPAVVKAYLTQPNGSSSELTRTSELFKISNRLRDYNFVKDTARISDAEGMVYLGRLYLFGDVVKVNQVAAFRKFQKSASEGNSDGQYYFGLSFNYGLGTKTDISEAMKWYQLAAYQGNAKAMSQLGSIYRGPEIAKDLAEAEKWNRKSNERYKLLSEGADFQAQFLYGQQLRSGPPGIEKNQAEGLKWMTNAAENHFLETAQLLGWLEGGELNTESAVNWIEKVIQQRKSFKSLETKSVLLRVLGRDSDAEKAMNEAVVVGEEFEVNVYGYLLLSVEQLDKAIEVFTLNTLRFPNSANSWDSLGEAYALKGDKPNAIKNFKKALSMNPSSAVKANSEKFLKQFGEM